MFYDESTDLFSVSIEEMVTTARRALATLPSRDADEFASGKPTDKERDVFFYDFSAERRNFRLLADREKLTGESIETLFYTENISRISKAERAEARGIGYLYAYLLSDLKGRERVDITTRYISKNTGDMSEEKESASKTNLDKFFEKCKRALLMYSEPEMDRQKFRLPSMKTLKFPYGEVRTGQGDFIRSVYRNLARGGVLYASMPTGTGKTVSTLYPALKCLGDGRADKVFYLTPKTTTQQAAADCLELMAKHGAKIRAVRLYAKDRCCTEGRICKNPTERCNNQSKNRMPEATLALYHKNRTVIDFNDCREIAKEYTVCPYELSLSYSELCDVIIGDINYFFDPAIHIRRYFENGGRYAILIDEAHNLVDRAREMYSAEISTEYLSFAANSASLGEHSKLKKKLNESLEKLNEVLFPYLKDEIYTGKDGVARGAIHTSALPSELYQIFASLSEAAEEELFKKMTEKAVGNTEDTVFISELKQNLKHFFSILENFDDSYKLFLYYDGGIIRIKLLCLDTGRPIREKLKKIGGAVFFSATLSPIEYFRSLLGGDRASDVFEGASPFAPEILSVSIVDSVSTRYSERERTLPSVSRVIASTLSARRGNYIIFSPSFEYAEALYKVFSAKYPKIRSILQTKDMTFEEKNAFLSEFKKEDGRYLAAFCVLGGIYSEGIDLAGESLIGAVVVGIGIPSLSYEREAMAEYYQEKYDMGKEYAYLYPGMNRVLQAAGRVIRQESDRGVIVLVDDRFADPIYKTSIPDLWRDMEYVKDPKTLKERLGEFWLGVDSESK